MIPGVDVTGDPPKAFVDDRAVVLVREHHDVDERIGPQEASRWASTVSSMPSRTVTLLTIETDAGGSGSIRNRYQASSVAS